MKKMSQEKTTTDEGSSRMVLDEQQQEMMDCDDGGGDADNRSTTTESETSKIMKALFAQQEYEEMKNTSWADLMEKQAIKSSATDEPQQSVEPEEEGGREQEETAKEQEEAEVAAQPSPLKETQKKEGLSAVKESRGQEVECITLSSDEYPSLSDAGRLDTGRRKISRPKRSRKTKAKFERSFELTQALAGQVLKMKGQIPEKLPRHAVKRGQPSEAATDDDENAPSSSKRHAKRRKKGGAVQKENIAASGFRKEEKFGSKDLPLSNPRSSKSRESSPSSTCSIASTLHIKEGWAEPKLGWCKDEETLRRRTKEIAKAKEKPVYARYLKSVPRHARKKGMPKTPNKYIQYSRRSWDQLMRIWKKKLYEWGGEEPSKSCESSNESVSGETSENETTASAPSVLMSDDENKPSLDEIKIEPDAAASLLGHLDIDTQTNTLTSKGGDDADESTLKGTPSRNVLGPRDFSQL